MLNMELEDATTAEINKEKEKFMGVCYILRSDGARYKKMLDNLKSLVNRGRDEYPQTLTAAFSLLICKSGEYDEVPYCWNYTLW